MEGACEFRSEARVCPFTNTFQHMDPLSMLRSIVILYASQETLVAGLGVLSSEAKPLVLEASRTNSKVQGLPAEM